MASYFFDTVSLTTGSICTFLNFASGLGCFIYTLMYLKLNHFLKWILKISTGIMIFCQVIRVVGLIRGGQEDSPSMLTCAIHNIPMVLPTMIVTNASFLISIIRYYMYSKSLQTKVAKDHEIIGIIALGLIINYGTMAICFTLEIIILVKGGIGLCANIEPEIDVPITIISASALVISQTGLCVYFDFKLKSTMKAKSQVQGVGQDQLVPWKVSDDDAEEDLKVPVKATLISTSVFFFCIFDIVFAFMPIYLFPELKSIGVSIMQSFLTIHTALHLPLILVYTVKHNGKKAKNQPPKGLQFHEEEENQQQNELQFHDDDGFEMESISVVTPNYPNVIIVQPAENPIDNTEIECDTFV